MAIGYTLEPLTVEETARWDEISASYPSRELFHRGEWLDYLAASRDVDIRIWAIREQGRTLGYFCGGLLRMGPFRILGSPLRSWWTNVMGPLVEGEFDQAAFLQALDRLVSEERVGMTELESPVLEGPALAAAGYQAVPGWTYLVPLTRDPDRMWAALDSTCRNRIRKAMKAGLTVEDADDPAIADEYYDQYQDLMRRKGLLPPFPREHAQLLFRHLKKADLLFALRVRDAEGRLLATGLFPHDERTVYFWGGASWPDGHALCPNDYLHWRLMCLAAERGLRTYNMSGHGRFKKKFGGQLAEVRRWHKFYAPGARLARNSYEVFVQTRASLVGRWQAVAAGRAIGRTRAGDGSASLQSAGSSAPGHPEAALVSLPWEASGAQRPSLRWPDLWRAPLHDFPIRDEILLQYFPVTPRMDVLEIGPGSGSTAYHLASRVRHLTLVDIAGENIAKLRIRLGHFENIRLVCADACAPGLAEAVERQVDAVFGLEVFDYVPDPAGFLDNIARVLRPDGRLLLQFPNYPPPLSPGMTHFHTRVELERLLAAAGFASWTIAALQLRPYAAKLYGYFHERPLRVSRRLRSSGGGGRPHVYDDTWAFQHGHRLEPFKPLLHGAWAALRAMMRLGGDCFVLRPVGSEILHRNLVVLARR